MDDVKPLILSILQFFDEQQRSPDLTPDAIESLEVASQCLESAYGISIRDVDAASRYQLPANLISIFAAGLAQLRAPAASVADKDAAEKLKSEGNELMKQGLFEGAIDCYTRAIQLDGRNAVYYCNRAAAFGKLGEHQKSIEDCRLALNIDPKYAKAFGRKGLAHTALGQHKDARECYKKALEIDPVNDSYRDNLKLSEQSMKSESFGAGPGAMGGLNLGGMDLGSLLNNPALMNMATSMLANPQMQAMMASMMSSANNPAAAAAGPSPISGLLQAGQQLAQQMQQSNPELVEQLRSQMRTQSTSENNDNDSVSPPGDDNPAPEGS